jgi:hypothetical protein
MGWFLGLDIGKHPIHMKEVLFTPSDMPIFRKILFDNKKGISYLSIDRFERNEITLPSFRCDFCLNFQGHTFDRHKFLFWISIEEIPLFIGVEDEVLQKILLPIRFKCGK